MTGDALSGLCLVVPTYEPPIDLPSRLDRFRQAGLLEMVVVDDGSSTASAANVLAGVGAVGATVVRRDRNAGIASSLNDGVRAALERGAKYVLTLDQDSDLEPEGIRAAVEWLAAARGSASNVWAVSPAVIDGQPWPSTRLMGSGSIPLEPIQSGLIIDVAAFESVGLFQEDLVIDGVDTEFWLRLLRRGMIVQSVAGYSMQHRLGEQLPAGWPVSVLRPDIRFSYHGPRRRYYMTRNRMLLVRAHGSRFPAWAFRKALGEIIDLAMSLLYGPRFGMQAVAVAVGFADSVRNKTGPAPAWLA